MSKEREPLRSLQATLNESLPSGFSCNYNYIHSKPKACEPLFSAPPGQDAETTRLTSHFLGVTLATSDGRTESDIEYRNDAVLVLGVEVLIYSTKTLTTIFVSKADSTGYTSHGKRAPIRIICTAFLDWLIESQRNRRPGKPILVSLFARAQAQYLFPGSSEHSGKHILDDRQLIKWWARALDPLIEAGNGKDTGMANNVTYRGYMIVPGYTSTDLRSYLPQQNDVSSQGVRWVAGDPLAKLAEARGVSVVLPRTLLPRFPDDPKARFMQDLDDEVGLAEELSTNASPTKRRTGKWKNIHDLARFWEAMEFRQECSSGRVVGFLWMTVTPRDTQSVSDCYESDNDFDSPTKNGLGGSRKSDKRRRINPPNRSHVAIRQKKAVNKKLTGPIAPRPPRIKAMTTSSTDSIDLNNAVDGVLFSVDSYDKLMHTLLHLDFGKKEVAAHSTRKWIEEIAGLSGQPKRSWGIAVHGTAAIVKPASTQQNVANNATVNDLGAMIRKKRKVAPS